MMKTATRKRSGGGWLKNLGMKRISEGVEILSFVSLLVVVIKKGLTVSFHPPPPSEVGMRLRMNVAPALLTQSRSRKGLFFTALLSVRFLTPAPSPSFGEPDAPSTARLAREEVDAG